MIIQCISQLIQWAEPRRASVRAETAGYPMDLDKCENAHTTYEHSSPFDPSMAGRAAPAVTNSPSSRPFRPAPGLSVRDTDGRR